MYRNHFHKEQDVDGSLKVSEDENADGILFCIQNPIKETAFLAKDDKTPQHSSAAGHEAITEMIDEVRDIYSVVSYIVFTVMNIIFNCH
jgi:hypothetical protein